MDIEGEEFGMLNLEIAGVVVRVWNKGELVNWVCEGHEVEKEPMFEVSATEEEIEEEARVFGREIGGGCRTRAACSIAG